MKKLIALLLLSALLLSACGSGDTPAPAALANPEEAAAAVAAACGLKTEELFHLSGEYSADKLDSYVLAAYGLEKSQWEGCGIYTAQSAADATEISVFLLGENSDPDAVKAALEAYKFSRQGAFFGYAPRQAAMAEQGRVVVYEDCRIAAVLICSLPETAESALAAFLGGEMPEVSEPTPEPTSEPTQEPTPEPTPEPTAEPTPEPTPESTGFKLPKGWRKYKPVREKFFTHYDNSALVEAYFSGNSSELSEADAALVERCRALLSQIITDGMSELEKEWAVYSWVIGNVEYDYRHYEVMAVTPKESFLPHGAIMNGLGVCLGYAAAYELLADMAGLECITVLGAALSSSEAHAWNMVLIEGEWYCLDPTWDNGRKTSPENCDYFNVSSDLLAQTDHQWDYENVPFAETDSKYTRGQTSG